MTRKFVWTALKYVWTVCILVAVAVVLWRNHDVIQRMLVRIPWWMLMSSFAAMFAAKFFLAENARVAAVRSGVVINYERAFVLYNLSQLGKYIPGSIWQFVGRAAAYRTECGAEYAQIRNSLLTESLWVVGGALLTGLLLCGPVFLGPLLEPEQSLLRIWFIALVGVGVLSATGLFFWRREQVLSYARSAIPTGRVLWVQAGIWFMLGLSFWLLAKACGVQAGLGLSVGLFAGAYALGFLVPFAPAGLGIRDVILTTGLIPFTSAAEAVAITVLARAVYLIVELVLVGLQSILLRRKIA